jgi:hypothetical protein
MMTTKAATEVLKKLPPPSSRASFSPSFVNTNDLSLEIATKFPPLFLVIRLKNQLVMRAVAKIPEATQKCLAAARVSLMQIQLNVQSHQIDTMVCSLGLVSYSLPA